MTSEMSLDIQALLKTCVWPHPVDQIRLIETHISWIVLTGSLAYKIKKPVNLGFVDFSSLQQRRFFCEEELRLNRRLAPNLYLRVVPITMDSRGPAIAGNGPIIDYAVCMQQFDDQRLLIRLAETHQLTNEVIDELASLVAEFHESISTVKAESRFADVNSVVQPAIDNFDVMLSLPSAAKPEGLESLKQWTRHAAEHLLPTFKQRAACGRIRECHGDMHLGNIYLDQHNRVTVFDGIEFNESLRWIDVASEVAFTMMDLQDHGCHRLAWRYLDRWLQVTGDYSSLSVLNFYLVYRAMVRAKIDLLRSAQDNIDQETISGLCRESDTYVRLAKQFTRPGSPGIIITFGPSGSGKTFGTQPLVEQLQLIRVRSDVERKRLAGHKPHQKTGSDIDQGLYSQQQSQAVYNHLLTLAINIVRDGFGVIVDATFLKAEQRSLFANAAKEHGIPFVILQFEAPPQTLRLRVQQRAVAMNDASEATEAVLQRQLQRIEPLSEVERAFTIRGGLPETLPRLQAQIRDTWACSSG